MKLAEKGYDGQVLTGDRVRHHPGISARQELGELPREALAFGDCGDGLQAIVHVGTVLGRGWSPGRRMSGNPALYVAGQAEGDHVPPKR